MPTLAQIERDLALDENEKLKDEIERLRTVMQEACDLLAERLLGSPARSAGHNARVRLEYALRGVDQQNEDRK